MTNEPVAEQSSSEDEPSSPDRQRRNQLSHAAILDAAFAQLETIGYHRMTIEGIAAQAGVGKATVYRWWTSKAQLVIEALSKKCPMQTVTPTDDLRADIRALVQYAIRVITKTPFGHVLPQLAAELADDPQARANLAAWLGPARAGHRALLYTAASRGDLPHDIDAVLVLDLIGGLILWRTLLGQRPDARLVDQLTNLLIDRALPRTGPAGQKVL